MAGGREDIDLKREVDCDSEGLEILSEEEEDEGEDEEEQLPFHCSRTDLVYTAGEKRSRGAKRARRPEKMDELKACKVAKPASEAIPPPAKDSPLDKSQNSISETNKENLKHDHSYVVVQQEVDLIVDFTQAAPSFSQELNETNRFTMACKEKRRITENDNKGVQSSNRARVEDELSCSSEEEIILTDDRSVTMAPIGVVDGKIVLLMDDNNNPLEVSKDPNISRDSSTSKDSSVDAEQVEIDVMEVCSGGNPAENVDAVTPGNPVDSKVNIEGRAGTKESKDDCLTQGIHEDLTENMDGVLADGGVVAKDGDLTEKVDEDLTEAAVDEMSLEDCSMRNETEDGPVTDTVEPKKDLEVMEGVDHEVHQDLANGVGAVDLSTKCTQQEEEEEDEGLQQKDENSQQQENESLKEKQDKNQEQDEDIKLQQDNKDLELQQEDINDGGERDNTQAGTVGAAINSNSDGDTIISNNDGVAINSNNDGDTIISNNDGVAINSNNNGSTVNDGVAINSNNDDDIGFEIIPSLVQKFQSCSDSQDPSVSNKSTGTKNDEMGFFDFEISESQMNNMDQLESQKLPPYLRPPLAPPPSLPLATPPSPPPLPPPLSTFPLNEAAHLSKLNDVQMVQPTTKQARLHPRQSSPPPRSSSPPSLSPQNSPPAKRPKTNRLKISRGGSEIRKLAPLINKDSMKLPGWDLRARLPYGQYFLQIVIPEGVGKSTSSGRIVFDGEEGPIWYHRLCVTGRSGSYFGVSHYKSDPPHRRATVPHYSSLTANPAGTVQPHTVITSSSLSIPSSSVAPLPSTTNPIGRSSLPVPPPLAPPTIDRSIYDDTVQDDVGGVAAGGSQCTDKIVIESDYEPVSSPDSADVLVNTRCQEDFEQTLPAVPSTKNTSTTKDTSTTVNSSFMTKNTPSTTKDTSSVAKDSSSSKVNITSTTKISQAAPSTKDTSTTVNTSSSKENTSSASKHTSPVAAKKDTSSARTKNTSTTKKSSSVAKDTSSLVKKNTTSSTTKNTASVSKDTSSVSTCVSGDMITRSRALEIMREFYVKRAHHTYGEENKEKKQN